MSDIDTNYIYQFIDTYYEEAMRRPGMYFSCPDAVEDVVFLLEHLRNLLEHDFKPNESSSYADFCVSKGLGSARLITRFREARPEGFSDADFYEVYGDFLREYLNVSRRNANPNNNRSYAKASN